VIDFLTTGGGGLPPLGAGWVDDERHRKNVLVLPYTYIHVSRHHDIHHSGLDIEYRD